jgi:hypothetical protein
MKLIQDLLTLFIIFFCACPSHAIELSDPAIHEVRAYVYDYTQEKKSHITIGGRLHKGVINKAGVKLSPNQLKRLLKAIAKQPLPKKIRHSQIAIGLITVSFFLIKWGRF